MQPAEAEQEAQEDKFCYSIFLSGYLEIEKVIIVSRNEMLKKLCGYAPRLNREVCRAYFAPDRSRTSLFERCINYIIVHSIGIDGRTKINIDTSYLYALFIRLIAILNALIPNIRVGTPQEQIKKYVEQSINISFESLEGQTLQFQTDSKAFQGACSLGGATELNGFNNVNLPLDCSLFKTVYVDEGNRATLLKQLIEYSKKQFSGILYSGLNMMTGKKYYSDDKVRAAFGPFPCEFFNFESFQKLYNLYYLYPRFLVENINDESYLQVDKNEAGDSIKFLHLRGGNRAPITYPPEFTSALLPDFTPLPSNELPFFRSILKIFYQQQQAQQREQAETIANIEAQIQANKDDYSLQKHWENQLAEYKKHLSYSTPAGRLALKKVLYPYPSEAMAGSASQGGRKKTTRRRHRRRRPTKKGKKSTRRH
jgi:hypothetical protein